MNKQISKKNIKWIKFGLGWNAVTLILTAIARASTTYQLDSSMTSAVFAFVFFLVVGGIVLYLNIYAFMIVQKQPIRKACNMALIMAVVSLLTLNLVGTLIIILSYLRIRRDEILH